MQSRSLSFFSKTWRLAALSKTDVTKCALASVLIGFLYVLFHLQGNTTDIELYGRSTLLWMVARWQGSGIAFGATDYSHGWLIPLVSVALVWHNRRRLFGCPKKVSVLGLGVVLLGLFFHWVGVKAQQPRLSLLSLIMLLWGVPFYFYGWELAKLLMFPCAYLVFCIPFNFLDSLTFPLRLYMTMLANVILNSLGFVYERFGTTLRSVYGGFGLEVADPCSGIRSLMAMTAIVAIYAYLTQRTLTKKWILFLLSVPFSMVGNMLRILTIAIASEFFGSEFGVGLYHDFSGYAIFMLLTIPLMVITGNLLDRDYTEVIKQWKRKLLDPT